MSLQIVPQSVPVSDTAYCQDAAKKMPVKMSIFSRPWWLFLQQMVEAITALQVANGTGNVSAQLAYATSALTLTSSYSDIPGCTLTLPGAGSYLITASFQFIGSGAGDDNEYALGTLMANGVLRTQFVIFAQLVLSGVPQAANVFQQWIYTSAGSEIVKLRALKGGGTGVSTAGATSSIMALRLS